MSEPSKNFACRNCGNSVFWDTNRHGKRYLACYGKWEGSEGGTKRIKLPHYCNETEVEWYQQELKHKAEQQAQALANGEIVKGQTVEVFKGRKLKIGLTGVVFWVAPEPDRFDAIRVGLTTDSGEKLFTNIKNVRTVQVKETAQ